MAKKIEKYLPVDYSDSFSIEVTENRLSPKDIILKVFAHNPLGSNVVCNKGLFSQTFRYRN